jgi:CheY-like chemotaxis protein
MATILVIDDQDPIRSLLRRALEGAGPKFWERRMAVLDLSCIESVPQT